MKFIKITIIILSITVFLFGIFYIQSKNNAKNQENIKTDVNIQENSIQNRTVFRTNTNTLSTNNTIINSESESTTSEELLINIEYTEGVEELENIKIKKLLFDWEITKDSELLKQALVLSKSTDNETVLEAWRPFMSKNSAELVKIIYKSNKIEETKKDIYSIFEWYIELSGEFETLTNAKKQEILKQYNQLK